MLDLAHLILKWVLRSLWFSFSNTDKILSLGWNLRWVHSHLNMSPNPERGTLLISLLASPWLWWAKFQEYIFTLAIFTDKYSPLTDDKGLLFIFYQTQKGCLCNTHPHRAFVDTYVLNGVPQLRRPSRRDFKHCSQRRKTQLWWCETVHLTLTMHNLI